MLWHDLNPAQDWKGGEESRFIFMECHGLMVEEAAALQSS
jgi:hypothetical protein